MITASQPSQNQVDSTDEVQQETIENLKLILESVAVVDQIELSEQKIAGIVKQLSRLVPASDIPGVVRGGMARLQERHVSGETVDNDIDWLTNQLKTIFDKATYLGVFAGPASAIWIYQRLLQLAGKKETDAFPNGLWQFYCEYALREDTAHHSNESCGFDTILNAHDIFLDQVDRVTAWIMAAVQMIHQYDGILENEWRERVYTNLIGKLAADLPDAERYASIYKSWRHVLPFYRDRDVGFDENYVDYRRRKFDEYFQKSVENLPSDILRKWESLVREAEKNDLPKYQQQMTILARLEPSTYREKRQFIRLENANIAVVYQGVYYFFPVSDPGGKPVDLEKVRSLVVSVFKEPVKGNPFQLTYFPGMRRASFATFLQQSKNPDIAKLRMLENVPIVINIDKRDSNQPLSALRRTERGIGAHSLTLIDTGNTMVFDQSHIFFDGVWGAALAEIMTNEATSWGVYLYTLNAPEPTSQRPKSLTISLTDEDLALIRELPRSEHEAWAESSDIKIKAILALRKMFKRRSDLIQLTVNDLLVLYRGIHAALYQPSNKLIEDLSEFALKLAHDETALQAMRALKQSWESQRINPSVLIPVDASEQSPRERVHPLAFEVPLTELNILELHQNVVSALSEYWNSRGDRNEAYKIFDNLQREYLTTLAAFGGVFNRSKEITSTGESASMGTMKLLAHLPSTAQHWLDSILTQFDVLNDMTKGNEVFSNIGAVAANSTLTRFLSAKDDNQKKNLVWGVMTDAEGVMRVTLRDFRPHVRLFVETGYQGLANQITQDYLDNYESGLNQFVTDLRRVTVASRETRLAFIQDIRSLNDTGITE